jgi:hypothetical protein
MNKNNSVEERKFITSKIQNIIVQNSPHLHFMSFLLSLVSKIYINCLINTLYAQKTKKQMYYIHEKQTVYTYSTILSLLLKNESVVVCVIVADSEVQSHQDDESLP